MKRARWRTGTTWDVVAEKSDKDSWIEVVEKELEQRPVEGKRSVW